MGRRKSDGPRHPYSSWDEMILAQSRIETGHRADRMVLNFPMFSTSRRRSDWSMLAADNGAIFYGPQAPVENLPATGTKHIKDMDPTMADLIRARMAYQADKWDHSCHLIWIDPSGASQRLAERLSPYSRGFTYMSDEKPLESLLLDLVKVRRAVMDATTEAGLIEPTKRRTSIVLLDLTEQECVTLFASARGRKMMEALLFDSVYQRINIMLLTPNADAIPGDLLIRLHWAAYLGQRNEDKAHDELFPDLSDSAFNVDLEVIGVLAVPDQTRLTVLHPLARTSSAWHLERTEHQAREDKIYARFLASLDDGTVTA